MEKWTEWPVLVVGGCTYPRNLHHIADGQATGMSVGYRASIFGRPMSAPAAQEPDSQENWHPRLADCFQAFATGGGQQLPAKLEVSFPTFRWVSRGSGVRRLCVSSRHWHGSRRFCRLNDGNAASTDRAIMPTASMARSACSDPSTAIKVVNKFPPLARIVARRQASVLKFLR